MKNLKRIQSIFYFLLIGGEDNYCELPRFVNIQENYFIIIIITIFYFYFGSLFNSFKRDLSNFSFKFFFR